MSVTPYIDCFNKINFPKIIDHPNILIAANFWDQDRYLAARICYKFMRTIDDLIDNHKTLKKGFSPEDKIWLENQVNAWLSLIKNNEVGADPFQNDLIETIYRFKIPHWCLDDFATAMLYDIDNDGFDTLDRFVSYSGGASVAPSSIFVHLCGLQSKGVGFEAPLFDVQQAAKPCALFSYLVHIIRDFQKDQFNHLSYFADDLIDKYDLSRKQLKLIAHGSKIPSGFRAMISEYMIEAEKYRIETERIIEQISPLIEPRYQLSLHIIYQLYLMVYERIDVDSGNFTMEELNPSALEIKQRVWETIQAFKPV